ncbi:MAG: hypothetical protein MUF01_14150 [Bryobacterales bacterium]|jgi:flagellar export protein FliJ|nr:hypothetical protein [Bryobacterales bacterium]
MAIFRYRLEVLLEQKRKALEEAHLAMAQRIATLRQAERRLTELQARAEQATQTANRSRDARFQSTGAMPAEELQRRCDEARWLHREAGWAHDAVLEQRMVTEDAVDALEAARRDVVEANRQVEVLQTHRARQEERHRREQERSESVEMDDVGSAQFQQRRAQ